MQSEQIESLLEKYYNGETSLEEEKQLQGFFRQTKLLPNHLKPHAVQFQFYDQEQDVEMDKFLSDDWLFEKIENPALSASAEEKRTKNLNFFSAYSWQIAASISLLLVTFWAGSYFRQSTNLAPGSTEIAALPQKTEEATQETETYTAVEPQVTAATETDDQERVLTPARKQPVRQVLVSGSSSTSLSASDRLQMVNQSLKSEGFTPAESKRLIKLLVKTMNKDGNLNVRLAACEALYQFKDHQEVRKAYIHALGTQKDPLMQLTLIEMVVKLKESTAVPQLQQLMQQEDLLPIVKFKAQEGLGTLI